MASRLLACLQRRILWGLVDRAGSTTVPAHKSAGV